MKKLEICNIDGYDYYLKYYEKEYKLNIEFYSLDNIQIGDVIYIPEKYLTSNEILSFGPLNEQYGEETTNDSEEIIVIQTKDGSQHYLKRFYG